MAITKNKTIPPHFQDSTDARLLGPLLYSFGSGYKAPRTLFAGEMHWNQMIILAGSPFSFAVFRRVECFLL